MIIAKKIYVALLIISLILTLSLSNSEKKGKEDRLENVLSLHCERISTEMNRAVYATEVLKTIVQASNGILTQDSFYALAHAVGEGIDYIAIQAMPDGIVKYAYPLQGNEKTIGHNVLLEDSTSAEASRAMNENRFVISGPFDLVQGSQGLALRNPLYLKNETERYFWGFITIVLPVPQAIKDTGVFELESLGYEYEVTALYKGEDIVFAKSSNFNSAKAMTMPIVIGDNFWAMSLYRRDDTFTSWVFAILLGAALLLVSSVIYIVLTRLERRLNRDLLTGAFNRRMLDSYIKPKHLSQSLAFTLFYVDLNDFKPVNDTYGHEVGDLLLIAFVKRLQSNIKSDGAIFRIGGDEFIVIMPNVQRENEIEDVVQRLATLSEKPFSVNGLNISVSSSIGFAVFPTDGKDMKELLSIADENMYKDKQRRKAQKKSSSSR